MFQRGALGWLRRVRSGRPLRWEQCVASRPFKSQARSDPFESLRSKAQKETRGRVTNTVGEDREVGDTDENKQRKQWTIDFLKSRPLLSKSLTPELEEQIVGKKTGMKFLLKQVLGEIHGLESRKFAMPLPASLDVEQWRTLLSFQDFRARFAYLDFLTQQMIDEDREKLTGCTVTVDKLRMTMEQIRAMDAVMSAPLVIPEEMVQEAVGQDKEGRRKIQLFLMHHEVMRQDGEYVPWKVSPSDVKSLAKMSSGSKGQCMKQMDFFLEKEQHKRRELIQKRVSKTRHLPAVEKHMEEKNGPHLYYGLGGNVIQLRLNKATELHRNNWNAIRAFQHSTPLVIDFSYYNQMTNFRHARSMIQTEIKNVFSWNREARTPYALHFTNVTPEVEEELNKVLSFDVRAPDSPILVTEQKNEELFNPDKLVYLSPDSRNDLKKVSDDDIYVIGALINKSEEDKGPLTLAKAKRLNIRHARFPLKRTIGMSMELNVDACVGMMCDMKGYNDWFFACRWVPARHMAAQVRHGATEEFKMRYQAHRFLMPTTGVSSEMMQRNIHLNPWRYREMYKRLAESKSFEEMQAIMETHKF